MDLSEELIYSFSFSYPKKSKKKKGGQRVDKREKENGKGYRVTRILVRDGLYYSMCVVLTIGMTQFKGRGMMLGKRGL